MGVSALGLTWAPEIGPAVVRVCSPRWGRMDFTMKRRRHTPDQIVRKLREADKLLAEGQDVAMGGPAP
jgi:hypothetical protein